MVQHPWQTPLAYNLTESSTEQSTQIRYIHLKNKKKVLYYHTFWCLTKYLDMLFIRLKNYTHEQCHQLIGSQIGHVRKKRFSVQCTGDPLQPVLDSRTRTALAVGVFIRYPARCTHAALLVFINSLFTAVHSLYCLSKLIHLRTGHHYWERFGFTFL